ncbi:MAG: glycerol-3-phosphate 1-O-acyltransferase PlsB [Gammaproteobacteria bacterium]|nr:glycerol-3-phosphate 1-O-acyltransferase PlsB [Gammaproteobacteria bacterium]NNF49561.1 glycerol-3-phosphate 1-O-acyltransferase PlsB [Woeseiaceae bacterium]MBT8093855.1 glycerol-3-phosphate 1-O-acyltransferase PlsB [Gammaproteobacteria bacterium]MBT8105954.1 glycerol-3-phosphate 1-O-acyltransferase PlsB [Gammaproteobacteria bacterium]NNK25968.1 glycerol-3-phosphate 1-O-acyltransferase PlsB [Woeseiaceae bacterium]
MHVADFLLRPLYWFAGKVFSIWARPAIHPDDPSEYITDTNAAVCYVLETGGLADVLALEQACEKFGLPSPTESFGFCGNFEYRRFVVLRRMRGFLVRRPRKTGSQRLKRLVEAARKGDTELLLIPVAIYWGRSPEKEGSLIKLLYSENWEAVGRIRKFITTILHGRSTLLRFSRALPLRSLELDERTPEIAYRKASRILRVHFRQRRIATVGPDLSHRRTLVNQVLRKPNVRRAIAAEGGGDTGTREAARRKARKYALEIAADISYPTIRFLYRILRWLWHQIYDGIELNHVDTLHELANDREVVYVPCHRSHFDYLLLAYVTYDEGLHVPHTAAGINLNFPIIGGILRRGGAFFLRRSFKGNRLYAAVFDGYIQEVLNKGHSMEYFIEGGRSRTGRLLHPKGGMLAMTINAYVTDPKRPIVFMPVYFGYEKLIEGGAFISELGGAAKKKESLGGLVRSIWSLRDYFGKVWVNFAEPIELEALLDRAHPGWRDHKAEGGERPAWLGGIVDELGGQIMQNINSAAAVTPNSLLAFVLLSTPKQTIGLYELRRQLQLSLDLLNRFRYSELVTIPDWTPDEIIEHGEKLDVISRSEHPMGEVVHMEERTAVLMTYFRNNILHLLAVPAAVACCFIQGTELEHEELQRLIRLIYPFMKKELYLKWHEDEVDGVTTAAIDALVELEILTLGERGRTLVRPGAGSAKAFQLLMLGQSTVPMLQRFYLVIAVLVHNGSGKLTRARLETMCQQSAERLSMIYGLHSPDFFNKTLFHDFIRMLEEKDVLRRNSEGLIEFDSEITSIGADARLVLGEEIRHSILSLTMPDVGQD